MGRVADAEERRHEILDRAFAAFADRGYHAVTMRDLARELGASTGALYHWFPGKEAVFEAMLAREVARLVEGGLGAIPATEDRAEQLQALARWIDARADHLRRLLRVALDAPQGTPGLDVAIVALRDALATRVDRPAADQVLAMILGTLVRGWFDPTGPALETIVRGG